MAGAVIPESPYATQLQKGFRALLFEPALEAEFHEAFVEQHLLRTRIGLAVVAVIYLLFLALKWRLEAGVPQHWGLVLRSLTISSTLLVLVVTLVKRLRPLLPWITVANYLVFASCVAALQVIAKRYGLDRQYEGLILMSFHLYAFSGLTLRPSLISGALIVLSYLLIGLVTGLADRIWAYQLLFIGLTQVIGAAALYSVEWVERDNFLRRRLYALMAAQDGLTGLYNRRAFFLHAEQLLRQAAREQVPVGVVMLDLDHFKPYNDRYGHPAGDTCLRAVGAAVREAFKRPMDLVARYGGEEFIGFWYDIPSQSLRTVAEQVRAAVQALKIPHAGAPSGRVTSSVGAVSCVPAESESLQALVERADRALYEAKERGRNRVVVEVMAAAAAPGRGRRPPTLSGAG